MKSHTRSACDSNRTWAIALVAALSYTALAALSGPALAQKADRPNVKAGDQWQFVMTPSPGHNLTWEIKAVTPEGIKATENGEPLLLSADLNVLESPRRKDSNRRLLRFPLAVGKSWTYANKYTLKDTGTDGRGKYSVVVLSYEKVQVPAGEFDAFKLESTGSFSRTSKAGQVSGLTSMTYWYAPAARAIVKQEISNPGPGQFSSELVELKLQP